MHAKYKVEDDITGRPANTNDIKRILKFLKIREYSAVSGEMPYYYFISAVNLMPLKEDGISFADYETIHQFGYKLTRVPEKRINEAFEY
jgi:hypothetical protein